MNLTDEQLNAFRKLWFIYGNDGGKCTMLNHKLVQGFYQYHEDRREAYREAEKNMTERFGKDSPRLKDLPTEECFQVCGLVLDGKIAKALEIAKE